MRFESLDPPSRVESYDIDNTAHDAIERIPFNIIKIIQHNEINFKRYSQESKLTALLIFKIIKGVPLQLSATPIYNG